MDKKWIVNINGKEHVIEADRGAFITDPESGGDVVYQKDGMVVVDGQQVQVWKEEMPKEIRFQIDGKSAIIKQKGLVNKKLELSLDGKDIKATK